MNRYEGRKLALKRNKENEEHRHRKSKEQKQNAIVDLKTMRFVLGAFVFYNNNNKNVLNLLNSL